jgi:sugar phosphate permease
MTSTDLAKKRTHWEFVVLACMFVGYMAFIFARTALPVASPEMLKDASLGLDEASYGDIAAWGTAGMIAGKLFTGVIADWFGGRRVFLTALATSAFLTFLMSWGTSATIFAGMNFLILFAVAASWPSIAGIIAVWYPPAKYGRVWGAISVSSRLAASISMIFLGTLLTVFSWNNIFRTAGVMSGLVVALIFFFLKAHPADVGLPHTGVEATPEAPPEENESNTTAAVGHFLDDKNPAEALWAFAISGRFWLICVSLMCTTILMEFLIFIPLYLSSFEGVSSARASTWASAFPLGCLLSVMFGGFIYDSVSRKGRVGLVGGMLGATAVCVAALWSLKGLPLIPSSVVFPLAVGALFLLGLTLATPYYLPPSIFSNEFGGKHCGLLVGLVDVAGFSASMVYLIVGGRMVRDWGWQSMIQLLFVVALLAMVITVWFAFEDYRRVTPSAAADPRPGVATA